MSALLPILPQDNDGKPLDCISLRNIRVDCIVGIYPHERHTPQPLNIHIDLYLDTRQAASTHSLQYTVDYAQLSDEIDFLLRSCRFELLETAAEAICAYLLAPPTNDATRMQITAATVCLEKPTALPRGILPALTVHRTFSEVKYREEQKPFGRVDIVYETPRCGIYRLRIAPQRSIPTHVHRRMDEYEMILGKHLLLQNQPVAVGTQIAWPRDFPHRYDNPSSVEQTILCIDRPAFIPDDEIEVHVPLSALTPPPIDRRRE